jgi:hypothetical protein
VRFAWRCDIACGRPDGGAIDERLAAGGDFRFFGLRLRLSQKNWRLLGCRGEDGGRNGDGLDRV